MKRTKNNYDAYKKISKRYSKTLVKKDKLRRMRISLAVLYSLATILVIGLIVTMTDNFMVKNAISQSDCSMTELAKNIDSYAEVKEYADQVYSQNETILEQNKAIVKSMNTVDDENKKLHEQLEKATTELSELQEAKELYENYGYSLTYHGGTDLTLDQLKTAKEACDENGVDMDLLLGVVLTESSGKETVDSKESTARGYGQLLAGTAKHVYEDGMNLGKYDHTYAYDGNLNLQMTAKYLGMLLDANNGNVRQALYSYRGLPSDTYVASATRFMK